MNHCQTAGFLKYMPSFSKGAGFIGTEETSILSLQMSFHACFKEFLSSCFVWQGHDRWQIILLMGFHGTIAEGEKGNCRFPFCLRKVEHIFPYQVLNQPETGTSMVKLPQLLVLKLFNYFMQNQIAVPPALAFWQQTSVYSVPAPMLTFQPLPRHLSRIQHIFTGKKMWKCLIYNYQRALNMLVSISQN